MGLFDRAKRNVAGGQDWAAQAAAAQELASQHLRDAGYTDGSPVTMANAGQVGGDMYADREVLTAYGNELNRIIAIGHSGTAVIRAAVDTGERIAGNPWFQLEVEVTPDGAAPYLVSKREMVAPQFIANYAAGSSHTVKVDPADAQNIAFTS
ncbi:hypothetical protein [Microbacterium sp. Leaf320]|uniref:hypothetical protein n=1 Tax=Microbacterium sp. Leaf320 TaxID=1736334 RepID=UPI0006F55E9A|nr:hypothetical protein [Microbacterium sp. Leaf320]KQQ66248.1 hypothetical protein ASF63_13195 [Microbacterium sp. Leaf320]